MIIITVKAKLSLEEAEKADRGNNNNNNNTR
jgi:hypothetical protein